FDDPQPEAPARASEAALDDQTAPAASQTPHVRGDARGDEHGNALVEPRPHLVRNARAGSVALSAGAFSLATTLRNQQCELFHLIGESLPERLIARIGQLTDPLAPRWRSPPGKFVSCPRISGVTAGSRT